MAPAWCARPHRCAPIPSPPMQQSCSREAPCATRFGRAHGAAGLRRVGRRVARRAARLHLQRDQQGVGHQRNHRADQQRCRLVVQHYVAAEPEIQRQQQQAQAADHHAAPIMTLRQWQWRRWQRYTHVNACPWRGRGAGWLAGWLAGSRLAGGGQRACSCAANPGYCCSKSLSCRALYGISSSQSKWLPANRAAAAMEGWMAAWRQGARAGCTAPWGGLGVQREPGACRALLWGSQPTRLGPMPTDSVRHARQGGATQAGSRCSVDAAGSA